MVRDGKPYLAAAYGYADLQSKTRAGRNTGYYIASSTKSYTGLACAILASRGLLDLDAPITKYLPEVKMAPPLDANTVTLRKLLTHTSGIGNDGIVFRTAFSGEHTPELLVSLLNLSKPAKPGFQYDNLGYVVASLVIERVTGRPWQKVLDETVFAPLGMHRTTAYMSEAKQWPMVTPYDVNRMAELEPVTLIKSDQMMHAAGGIVTTPADLLHWLEANINDGRIGSRQAIPPEPFREAHRKQVDASATRDRFKAYGYGLGWYQARLDNDEVLFHLGGFRGCRAHVSFMPERKIGVAVVTNSGGMSGTVMNFIAAAIYDRLLNKPDAFERNLATLKENLDKQRATYLADVEKRSKRPWMLKHANVAYAGIYESPLYGTLKIEVRGEQLVASLAHLTATLEAFTEPETARVELVPGSGEILAFSFRDGDTADSVKWGDDVFRRVQ
ncbi:MAG TPA: serine hydrolase [Thermoanaerobaculia bacterium]|nr:serine hydrolase [Thermoanaerobaculia bacterium]